jgi:hypothetical protein
VDNFGDKIKRWYAYNLGSLLRIRFTYVVDAPDLYVFNNFKSIAICRSQDLRFVPTLLLFASLQWLILNYLARKSHI